MAFKQNSFGILSIRNRIVAFAVLAALVPSFCLGLLLYNMLYSTLVEKVEQKFIDSAGLLEREISLWFKERNYDLTVFSSSFIINDNFEKYLVEGKSAGEYPDEMPVHVRVMERYLSTLQEEFGEYKRLLILNGEGRVVASSGGPDNKSIVVLPDDLARQLANGHTFSGDVFFDEPNGEPMIVIGTPIAQSRSGNYKGLLVTELQLNGLLPLLESTKAGGENGASVFASLFLLDGGRHFLMADGAADVLRDAQPEHFDEVNEKSRFLPVLYEFQTTAGERMMGLVIRYEQLGWGLFLSESYNDIFARAINSRNRNLILISVLGLFLGLAAYGLIRQILVPLQQLAKGARQVAKGDRDVQLTVLKEDEIGFTTNVFNKMVTKLKQSELKLKELATVDTLTSLVNRKRIMSILNDHFKYYQRYRTQFSVLMIDVDHFKKVNDTYGHQAGDEVLRQIAEIFLENLRSVDSAGRYGGEEFLVILAESPKDEALKVAERIRKAVAKHLFVHDGKTLRARISIGVSRMMEQDKDDQSVIRRADIALYRAKERGRDQVFYLASDEEAQTNSFSS